MSVKEGHDVKQQLVSERGQKSYDTALPSCATRECHTQMLAARSFRTRPGRSQYRLAARTISNDAQRTDDGKRRARLKEHLKTAPIMGTGLRTKPNTQAWGSWGRSSSQIKWYFNARGMLTVLLVANHTPSTSASATGHNKSAAS